jgi:hypothetical protein
MEVLSTAMTPGALGWIDGLIRIYWACVVEEVAAESEIETSLARELIECQYEQ